ncbi:hypothetical protein [Cystobacter ferrugineus]|uniref:Uncharacterized protein n=1 Tax=Cystobacter ferrugineus TaxID=83449 RepID=A0A1L9B7K5_9BACT|nr:hypothetical protein [Cystobacter ferrugineus]OJH38237.1 hypothetical protein BON30_24145 [Cystobacter ferrugineus]
MVRCAALQNQQFGRDLAQLEELADQVDWIADSAAADVMQPLILSGLWVSDNPDRSREMLRRRSAAGRVSLLVPRWRAGDIAPLVGASSSIEVRASNFDGVAWEDGQQYDVSGVSSLRTVLHVGRWAVATGVGTVLLCFRPHMTAGPIVICTASVAGRPSGVQVEAQRRLLMRILMEAEKLTGPSDHPKKPETRPTEPAPDLATYLRDEGPVGAALLLALIACKGNKAADLASSAKAHLGIALKPVELQRVLNRLPETSTPEIAAALKASGWGAHLRRVEQAMAATEKP